MTRPVAGIAAQPLPNPAVPEENGFNATGALLLDSGVNIAAETFGMSEGAEAGGLACLAFPATALLAPGCAWLGAVVGASAGAATADLALKGDVNWDHVGVVAMTTALLGGVVISSPSNRTLVKFTKEVAEEAMPALKGVLPAVITTAGAVRTISEEIVKQAPPALSKLLKSMADHASLQILNEGVGVVQVVDTLGIHVSGLIAGVSEGVGQYLQYLRAR
jgi:hypothetical protein